LSRINGFYPSNSVAAIPPELSPKFIPDSSARRRGSIRGSAHHWIPAYAGMTVSREADRWWSIPHSAWECLSGRACEDVPVRTCLSGRSASGSLPLSPRHPRV